MGGDVAAGSDAARAPRGSRARLVAVLAALAAIGCYQSVVAPPGGELCALPPPPGSFACADRNAIIEASAIGACRDAAGRVSLVADSADDDVRCRADGAALAIEGGISCPLGGLRAVTCAGAPAAGPLDVTRSVEPVAVTDPAAGECVGIVHPLRGFVALDEPFVPTRVCPTQPLGCGRALEFSLVVPGPTECFRVDRCRTRVDTESGVVRVAFETFGPPDGRCEPFPFPREARCVVPPLPAGRYAVRGVDGTDLGALEVDGELPVAALPDRVACFFDP